MAERRTMNNNQIVAKRPPKRERTEAFDVLRKEASVLRARSEKWINHSDEYTRKIAGQHQRKAERIERVLQWVETL